MKLSAAPALLLAALLAGCVTAPPPTAKVAMWRLDCGLFDIDDLEGQGRVLMPVSCYLIRRGDELIMFDAGLTAGLLGKPRRETGQTISMERTLADQLAEIGIDPAQVSTLVVSHYHGDHHGQADLFPNARLVIGAGDAAALRGVASKGALAPWLDGQRSVLEIDAERDLLGDGTVVALFTPGHTPGHLSMLVRLAGGGVILSGDLIHQRKQLETRAPSGNHVDKVRGKAELERVMALAVREKAMIVVGHDREDVGLLPAFPAAAR